MHSYANELGRLAQGIRNIPGTNTIKFIRKDQVPKGTKVTYGRIIVTYHLQKSEPNRSRSTAGGDRLDSPVDTATPTADLTSIKLLWNSVISTPGSRYVTMDVKNFYLNTPPRLLPIYEIANESHPARNHRPLQTQRHSNVMVIYIARSKRVCTA